ncbi:hypothetical protein Vadar_009654 [Vaccinium darrowii]|uniref:Uncharacterized protein n=1 Tax=Vaccinium darrowii TaxID=229202 RepID=A0ACB7XQV5_9ERIC|nr:hypothetical protein Vadar_009654 [Vaccinium darrowii]
MVFSSIPAYLDPSNWQQQPNLQPGGISNGNTQFLQSGPPGGGVGSIRPGSMVDRARMANLPMPEAGLKCPRCESTHTKFCYFNNYNLTQPRHFCKTCRRYWTRGGALRNVPVGGGCRRNKRSKASNSSKSPVTSDHQKTSTDSSTKSTMSGLPPQIPPQTSFLSNMSQLTEFDVGDSGLNYSGISAPVGATSGMNFQGGNNSLGGVEQLQPPPMTSSSFGFDVPAGLYPFQGGLEPSGYVTEGSNVVQPKLPTSMKLEENSKEFNLSRQFLRIQGNDQYYWSPAAGTVAWTDLSGFRSSTTNNP